MARMEPTGTREPRPNVNEDAPQASTGWDRLRAEGRLRPAETRLRDLGPPLPLVPGAERPSDRLARMRDG